MTCHSFVLHVFIAGITMHTIFPWCRKLRIVKLWSQRIDTVQLNTVPQSGVWSQWFRGPQNTLYWEMCSLVYHVNAGGLDPQFDHHRKLALHGVTSEWQFHLPPEESEAERSRVVQHTTLLCTKKQNACAKINPLPSQAITCTYKTWRLTLRGVKIMSLIWMDYTIWPIYKEVMK